MALLEDGVLVDEHSGDPSRTHGERLPGDLVRLLTRHALRLTDIDLFGVAAGPGSFTGLRIGIATVQGVAFATGRPVVPVSALDARARRAAPDSPVPILGIWMDAQRHEVFAALWTGAGARGDRLTSIGAASVGLPDEILARWLRIGDAPIAIAGEGALAYRDLLVPHRSRVHLLEDLPPIAGEIARMAVEAFQAGQSVGPAAIQPIYIRRPDAELARERAQRLRS